MSKYRVLILSEGFGAGHTRAAYALSGSLRKLSPDVQSRVLELGSFLNPKVAPLFISAYKKTVITQPRLVRMMYKQQYKKSINRLATLALHRLFYTHARDVIQQLRPDLVVCTHPIPSAVISRLKRLGLNVPLCTVITDYDAHGTWISGEVDHYLVSTEEVKNKVLLRGVSPFRIDVTGIPVHPSFWEHPVKASILQQMGLKDMPTVLVMSGGWGLMNGDVLNPYLTRWRQDVQLVFCVGSNEKAMRKLNRDPRFQHEHIRVMGYTKEIDKLMEVSDLLITKPGGMTCTEGLAKAIPMLFHNPLPGQEEENCEYFTSKGWGERLSSLEVVGKWMARLTDAEAYEELVRRRAESRLNIEKLRPMQSARRIIEILETTNKVPF
ncbi:MGDG synthase family glycosyltransferase [Saccharibacillus kuerlensis]|uniref:UDP-glucuronosyltransferase n=1 Tax=Saccharibacillus kuerlensis TaxID=459527 RepID=A0ABQ2KTW1_9BACL|nr:glycosyltransferase [Saccharibacillus kuerlensis]GGN92561.1 UDP-glucuronosyltransferase [Saccharibacillus kuerlensis]